MPRTMDAMNSPLLVHTSNVLGSGRGASAGSIQPTVPMAMVAGMKNKLRKTSQYSRFHLSARNGRSWIIATNRFVTSPSVTQNSKPYTNSKVCRKSHQNPGQENGAEVPNKKSQATLGR